MNISSPRMGLMQLIIGDLIFFDVKTSSRRFAERWDREQKFHVMVLGGFWGGIFWRDGQPGAPSTEQIKLICGSTSYIGNSI